MLSWNDADDTRKNAAARALDEGDLLGALLVADLDDPGVMGTVDQGVAAIAKLVAQATGEGLAPLSSAVHDVLRKIIGLRAAASGPDALTLPLVLSTKEIHPLLLTALWVIVARRAEQPALVIPLEDSFGVQLPEGVFDAESGQMVVLAPDLQRIVSAARTSPEVFEHIRRAGDRAMFAAIMRRRGAEHTRVGTHQEAYRVRRLALTATGENVWPVYEVGESALAGGDLTEALVWFQQARERAGAERDALEARIVDALARFGTVTETPLLA